MAGDRKIAEQAVRLRRDPDRGGRNEALLYLAREGGTDPLARIQELGGFADFSIRAGMVAFLSRPGGMQNLDAARVILRKELSDRTRDRHDGFVRQLLADDTANVVLAKDVRIHRERAYPIVAYGPWLRKYRVKMGSLAAFCYT